MTGSRRSHFPPVPDYHLAPTCPRCLYVRIRTYCIRVTFSQKARAKTTCFTNAGRVQSSPCKIVLTFDRVPDFEHLVARVTGESSGAWRAANACIGGPLST